MFEHDPEFKQAKSMLVDLLRGRVVDGLNLMVGLLPPPALAQAILLCLLCLYLVHIVTKVWDVCLQDQGERGQI